MLYTVMKICLCAPPCLSELFPQKRDDKKLGKYRICRGFPCNNFSATKACHDDSRTEVGALPVRSSTRPPVVPAKREMLFKLVVYGI